MELSNVVHRYGGACENLLASIRTLRPLTEDEVLLVRHYCNEILQKIPPPPPMDLEPAP